VRGGYTLAKARHQISLHEIIGAVSAIEAAGCRGKALSLLHTIVLPTLLQAEEHFRSTLKRITVEDLVRTASLNTLAQSKTERVAR
jgi:DNA-binding IscR family transcriptional regulator